MWDAKSRQKKRTPSEDSDRLRIRAVWPESPLGTYWIAIGVTCLHVDYENSDQVLTDLIDMT